MPESMNQILDWARCLLTAFVESITIIATFVAAFAGALGAQSISDRNQRRENKIKEIRNTNAAITAAFSIYNSSLSLKKQYVKELKETFDKTRNEAVSHREGLENGTIPAGTVFEFNANLVTFMPLSLPTKMLEKQIFEKISASGRALWLFNALNGALQSLNESITQRNHLIHQFRNTRFSTHADMASWYFGFPNAGGHTDNVYPDTVKNIHTLVDDCIFFSTKLCEILEEHGNNIKKKNPRKLPSVNQVKFDTAYELGLMPNEEDYHDWYSSFQTRKKS